MQHPDEKSHTHLATAASSQPGVPFDSQHAPSQAPQSSGQPPQCSPVSHEPLPQTSGQTPQSAGQLSQLSLTGSHLVSPQRTGGSPQPSMWVPAHTPEAQTSSSVHLSSSSQGAVLKAVVQPVAESQPSSVHTSPSSQSLSKPTQSPDMQLSKSVHASPSSQRLMLFA